MPNFPAGDHKGIQRCVPQPNMTPIRALIKSIPDFERTNGRWTRWNVLFRSPMELIQYTD